MSSSELRVGVEGWKCRCSRKEISRDGFLGLRNFFSVHRLTEMEKLDMATLSFDSEALAWFQWEDRRRSLSGWANLKSRLLDHFGMTQEGSLYDRFLALQQEGSVREFRQTFESTAAVLPGLPEHVLEGVFINGLRPDIRAKVRLVMPKRLEELMEYAQRVEDRNWTHWALAHQGLGQQLGGPHNTEGRGSWYCDSGLSKRSSELITKGLMGQTTELEARPNTTTRWSPNSTLQKIPQYSSPQTNLSPNMQLPSLQRASTTTGRAPIASPCIKLQDKRNKGLCYRCDGLWGIDAKTSGCIFYWWKRKMGTK